ncbi:aminoacyl-tRNA hydrolase [Candidatus Synchoanobacter obligatus]|uniref:Peptidyl-tRNA hydrolase n=1 Tax=Candidatus Synchoanobacter obligatus TaxID=2919597 RepID=A0ABT1L5K8_9GAMM|nr:aminoacyl-tRNA hydrolase [Candidatus Synchoanobacter obligatus]MCP8352221.1 aminoacyl-tRNA hydrolase [Candidatus Synchoanobacter obligatus]
MKILSGLGNPGRSYENDRHNVGYWLIDALIEAHGLTAKEKPNYYVYIWQHDYGKTYLLKSKQYMNDSGLALRQLMQFYKIPVEDVWVAYDDMDFYPGCSRVKKQGGAGGHNGIKSIISHVGPSFNRLRVGVGRPKDAAEVKQYVLASPSRDDREKIEENIDFVLKHINLLLQGKYASFTEILHSTYKAT